MSLIGSLDDLGLGDILQIINLSQKSGVLIVIGDRGEGRVLFRDGLVRGAAQKGGPQTLRDVLIASGMSPDTYQDAAGSADPGDVSKVLIERGLITEDRLIALCREVVESAVVSMFSWRSGEFSFDVRSEGEPGDPELLLATGISAQFLAMEGARLQDEGMHAGESQFDFASSEASGDLEWEAPVESVEAQAEAVDILADRAVATVAPEGELSGELVAEPEVETDSSEAEAQLAPLADTPLIDAEPVAPAPGEPEHQGLALPASQADRLAPGSPDTRATAASLGSSGAHESAESEVAHPSPILYATKPALVVIDPELRVLEWTKRVLKAEFERVHIFQHSNLGLVRIRQYLSRAEMPLVLVSPEISGEPAAGIRDAVDFVKRLKVQVPLMPVLWLCGQARPDSDSPADGSVTRPRIGLLRDARAAHERDGLAEVLRREVQAGLARVRAGASGWNQCEEVVEAEPLAPREATDEPPADPDRGDILSGLIEFAGEGFSRVAMFMVRDGRAEGMAERGLSLGGGPGGDSFRQIGLAVRDCGWFESVLAKGEPICAAPGDADRELCDLLCGPGQRPLEAYVAPIESSGQIVALLYADHLPEQREVGDTSSLDLALSQAGLALDEAVLERAQRDGIDD